MFLDLGRDGAVSFADLCGALVFRPVQVRQALLKSHRDALRSRLDAYLIEVSSVEVWARRAQDVAMSISTSSTNGGRGEADGAADDVPADWQAHHADGERAKTKRIRRGMVQSLHVYTGTAPAAGRNTRAKQ
mmetsp:Transcript_12514/g.35991  ORF Transcript_12514/g.35991 Transcript_12514/m.35991 type:complete len:132 (+) Transcript_12514:1-396(+)